MSAAKRTRAERVADLEARIADLSAKRAALAGRQRKLAEQLERQVLEQQAELRAAQPDDTPTHVVDGNRPEGN